MSKKLKPITVVIKEPGQAPRAETIENTLEALQKVVGGYIETVQFRVPGTLVVCNSEGKQQGLPFNFYLGWDHVVGSVVICSSKGEHFAGLSEKQQAQVIESLRWRSSP